MKKDEQTRTQKQAYKAGRNIADHTAAAVIESTGGHEVWQALVQLGRAASFEAGSAITPKRRPKLGRAEYLVAVDGYWAEMDMRAASMLGAGLRDIAKPTVEEERRERAKREAAMGQAMREYARAISKNDN